VLGSPDRVEEAVKAFRRSIWSTAVDLNRYLADKKIFKSAHDYFFSYQIKYHQNSELFKNLQSALIKPISYF